jgi:hypothetical protein
MATDLQELGEALHTYLAADGDLTALLETYATKPAIFMWLAPAGAAAPYVCIFNIGIEADDTHSSRGECALYQVDVFAYKLSECNEIMSKIDTRLHWQTVTPISGYTSLIAHRASAVKQLALEDDEELFGLTADYKIKVQEV